MITKITEEIRDYLRASAPQLTKEQKTRMYKILNSNNPNFKAYGNKHSEIEKYVKEIQSTYNLSYLDGSEISQRLIKSDVHDEQIAGIFLLNRFKKNFTHETVKILRILIPDNFDTWAITDSTMIRVIGPFLGKRGNEGLAQEIIAKWSNSDNLWVRRASIVILLKLVMLRKEFEEAYVFEFIEKMMDSPEDYIQKGIGWLLKTCSKFNPDSIFRYLMSNKKMLPRLILRYASEKLPKEMRQKILSR
jgi:3-methyladenine DNA glycosylase AlkD